MPLDQDLVHPFVRIHIVNMETGKYLAKTNSERPGVANKESISLIDSDGNVTGENVDFLMPMSTKFFDMRITGMNNCSWNEEFIVNEMAAYIC